MWGVCAGAARERKYHEVDEVHFHTLIISVRAKCFKVTSVRQYYFDPDKRFSSRSILVRAMMILILIVEGLHAAPMNGKFACGQCIDVNADCERVVLMFGIFSNLMIFLSCFGCSCSSCCIVVVGIFEY